MAEPPPANGPDPAPDNQQPQGNPAAAESLGADDFLNSQVNMVYQDLQGGRSLFFIAWVFCCVGSVVMLIPLAFLVMPLISGGTARVHRAGLGGRRPPTPRVTVSTAATRISIPTFTIPPRQTVAVPAHCRRPSPTIEVNTTNMKNNSFKNGANAFVAIPSGKQVYCVYNISRVRRSYGFDFLLDQFPWPICPNVIYWSLGVNSSNGHLFSRAPELDSYSGFYNITSAARDYSPDTKVLFTLGGYPEDSVLFLLLGNETLAQNNLLQMVIAMLYRLQFNGLNIHLAQNPHCEQYAKRNLGGLRSFILGLREMVEINGPIDDFKITVMVDTNEDLAHKLLLLMRDLIDVVFLDTYRLFANNLRNSTEFCLNYGTFLSKFKQHTSVDRCFVTVSQL
ncbi:hypothetical protein HPB50_014969 [Hyalomma asiaticum]|uniref:Uncharacterized protein n=1 Tax=Hyalomma asiaticum TaxID=266040 RepID=A0ACB7S3B1_HYAAI|nr:hypothetical protein HPB50_014969 [Hyalomma asiaticum]